ncbi:MAG: Mu transposase C-terminal domain-containing protein [Acutalibacteraceae bacterium]|nr:Mu transposase C-terminal domain-containing protein [Acutalibacteraceae bacterium]
MYYLTTKEFAEIKGCSERYVKRLAKDGKISTERVPNKYNGYKYKIPLSELPVPKQIKWYQDNKIPLPDYLMSKTNDKQCLSKNLNYEELTEEQRKQVSIWIEILTDWKRFISEYNGSKTEANKVFVAKYADKYPVKISIDILYRKQKIYKAGNVADLVDGRGLKRRGISYIDENLWQAFLYYYLDESQHPIKACYDYTRQWAEQEHPELLPLPNYTTFYRHLDSDVPAPVATYAREGEKAYKDKYGFYIRREYENMESNDYWIADNHTFDVFVSGDNNKPKRMYLTAFMDARSGIFTGVYITDNPSSQATLYALRKGIIKYGIPKNVYVDNGREFLTSDVGGLGHRKKKSQREQIEPPPIFKRLGINMTNAIVRNARAKTIERRFEDVKNRLSRLFDTYTGGNILERPERLKKILKDGDIIDEVEFTHIVEDMLNYNFNYQEYNGPVQADKGLIRNEVYAKHLKEKRVASEEDLWLMMLRTTRPHKVSRRGVYITVAGQRLEYINDDLLLNWQGKKVYVRYDPENLASVRVYDLEDRFITTAKCADETVLEYGADKETVANAMREVRRQERIVRDSVKANRVVALGSKTALDIVLCEVENNKRKETPRNTAVLSIQRADEKTYNEIDMAVGAEEVIVDISRMIKNAEKRKDEY